MKLFRFRNANKYSMEDLIDETITTIIPELFNDPFDTDISYNENELVSFLNENYNTEIEKLLSDKKLNYLFTNQYEFLGFMLDELNKAFKKINTAACFIEKKDIEPVTNELMWAHYSNNYSGFCVEYDKSEVEYVVKNYLKNILKDFDLYFKEKFKSDAIEKFKEAFGIFKVQYTNEYIDQTDFIKTYIGYYFNSIKNYHDDLSSDEFLSHFTSKFFDDVINSLAKKRTKNPSDNIDNIELINLSTVDETIITKKKQWEYENETRIIIPNYNPTIEQRENVFKKIGFIKPQNIYYGKNIDKVTLNHLRLLCKSKGIGLYCVYENNNIKAKKLEVISDDEIVKHIEIKKDKLNN